MNYFFYLQLFYGSNPPNPSGDGGSPPEGAGVGGGPNGAGVGGGPNVGAGVSGVCGAGVLGAGVVGAGVDVGAGVKLHSAIALT